MKAAWLWPAVMVLLAISAKAAAAAPKSRSGRDVPLGQEFLRGHPIAFAKDVEGSVGGVNVTYNVVFSFIQPRTFQNFFGTYMGPTGIPVNVAFFDDSGNSGCFTNAPVNDPVSWWGTNQNNTDGYVATFDGAACNSASNGWIGLAKVYLCLGTEYNKQFTVEQTRLYPDPGARNVLEYRQYTFYYTDCDLCAVC